MLAAAPRIRTYKQVCRVFFVIDKKKTQFTADLTKLEGVKGSHSASKVTAFRKQVNNAKSPHKTVGSSIL